MHVLRGFRISFSIQRPLKLHVCKCVFKTVRHMHVRWCLAESETYEGMKTMSKAAEIKCVTDLIFFSNLSPRFH